MKLWLSLLLVLAVISVLEARRGGRGKGWQKRMQMQAARRGPPMYNEDDDVKDDDDNQQQNKWMSKKQRKWAMKRQRKMDRMNRRRGMMSSAADTMEETPDDSQVGQDEVSPVRRLWQGKMGNRAERRQKWRKIKKMKHWHKKNHGGNRPSCFCLQSEQLEKLQELIKEEGMEAEFPQIMPREPIVTVEEVTTPEPEEEVVEDETTDAPEDDDDDIDDFDDGDEEFTDDDVEDNSGESEDETTTLPMSMNVTEALVVE